MSLSSYCVGSSFILLWAEVDGVSLFFASWPSEAYSARFKASSSAGSMPTTSQDCVTRNQKRRAKLRIM